MAEFFVIRSKKTGKTFLRILRTGYDWVQFREEEPTMFSSPDAARLFASSFGEVEVIPYRECPAAAPLRTTDEFVMSETTRQHLVAALDGLDQPTKSQVLGAMADLLAEAEVHIRKKYAEEFRHEWAESLATMLRFDSAPVKK